MNTISTDFKFFIEHDVNPFIVFSHKGAIKYLNKSAEFIVTMESQKKIYDLALLHAPQSFGSRVALMELSYGSYEFYGINIMYKNENEIAVQLYSRPRPKTNSDESFEGYTPTDINLLLQANIELFKINFNGKISLMTDYSMPQIKLHQNSFSMLLRKIFSQLHENSRLNITLTVKIGSKIIINNKRYPIFILKIEGDKRISVNDEKLRKIAVENHIDLKFTENSTILEIPAI